MLLRPRFEVIIFTNPSFEWGLACIEGEETYSIKQSEKSKEILISSKHARAEVGGNHGSVQLSSHPLCEVAWP